MNTDTDRPGLALFDLDNTLLDGDSDLCWGTFLAEQGLVDAEQHRRTNEAFYRQYQDGQLDIHAFLSFALEPLAAHPLERLRELRERFMREYIEPMILPAGERLLAGHRDKGHELLIITATNRFVTEPIARRLGVAHLLATDPEMRDGRYTGRITGTPCFQEGKITRFEQWLAEHGPGNPETWFYSDSHNDIPLLSRVDHPVTVDPDEPLRRHARRHGWGRISLRADEAGNRAGTSPV